MNKIKFLLVLTIVSTNFFNIAKAITETSVPKSAVESTEEDSNAQNNTDTPDALKENTPSEQNTFQHIPPKINEFVPRGVDLSAKLSKIAFGSCYNQNGDPKIWSTIINSKPDLFVLLGDSVYDVPGEPMSIQHKKLLNTAEYRYARETIPFLAMWDDHDYGINDGGTDFPGKKDSKKEFLKTYHYIANSIPLERDGIFHSKLIGTKKQTVQIILLDLRSYRSPLVLDGKSEIKRYIPNTDPKATILGDEQWKWLETELKKPAHVRFLISSIQLNATTHTYEKWSNFPLELEKLHKLLKKTNIKNLFVISGDRHMSVFSKVEVPGYGPLIDFTTSSLNKPKPPNEEQDSSYLYPPYNEANFGSAEIDWKNQYINFAINDIDGKEVRTLKVKLK